jgi:hypothetical protein
MDRARFDQFTKRISRRGVTRGLLAGGAAGAVTLLGARQSQAKDCEYDCAKGCPGRGQAKSICIRQCLCECGRRNCEIFE